MKLLLLVSIRFYWALWPRHLNRSCLYQETCSNHVYRTAHERGGVAALRALVSRIRTCRPGYAVTTDGTVVGLRLRDGTFLPQHLVAQRVIAPVLREAQRIEQMCSDSHANA